MKKTTNWMLTALLAMGLSMGFIACSDDDDDNSNGGVPTNEAEYKEAGLGWDIITQLTAERTAPEGWQNMTFEPTIGKASETDPYTRIVSTNDVAAAAERFGGLVGLPDLISETTTSFTYNQEGMGKLTYQMGSVGGQYLAQVDVDLKQVPHLKKILYQTPEQMGNNGSFAGTACYRFGDVVEDQKGYYWICVRPAFGPEGKEDSHWMCLSQNLPDENIKAYKTSTGVQNYLPTGLGKSTEHMQNAAEMFYAMLHPNDWFQAAMGGTSTSKPKMFNDFNTNKIQHHNTHFWQLVCTAWENQGLFEKVLGVTKETLDSNKEWHMLYSGYSWWFTTSWNCSLYEATFKNGKDKKANMHDATYASLTKDMHNIILDAKSGDKVGTVSGDFFGNDNKLRWYARYKKGSELGGGAYNVKNFISGCKDVYVFNRYYYQDTLNGFFDLSTGPEAISEEFAHPKSKSLSDVQNDDRLKFVGQDGRIYDSKVDALKAGTKAVAMIVDTRNTDYTFVGDPGSMYDQKWFETNKGCIKKGIAIALEDGNLSGETYEENNYNDQAPKANNDITDVKDYESEWNKNHHVSYTGARWMVPSSYHWQRMLLPYGLKKIMVNYIIKENLVYWNEENNTTIPEMSAFVKDVHAAGGAFQHNGFYLVAGYWCDYYLNEKRVYSVLVDNESPCHWTISNPDAARYVLVW